jgi:hypothetical protein
MGVDSAERVAAGNIKRRTGVRPQLGPGDQRGRGVAADGAGHDLVVVAVDHERRHVELVEVLAGTGSDTHKDQLNADLLTFAQAASPKAAGNATRIA